MKEVLPVAGKEPVVNQDDILENFISVGTANNSL